MFVLPSSSSSTWQNPPSSSSNADDTLPLPGSNAVMSKHKSSSIAASITGALKSAIALSGGNGDLAGGEAMITYVPQPKLVEQLGWDEPDIKVTRRPNFDDGTSIWGDPMELVSAVVKKWTNGTKAPSTNPNSAVLPPPSSSSSQQQQQQQQQQVPPPAAVVPTQPIVQKPISASNSGASSSQMIMNNENWPKQQSPTLVQQPASQWTDASATSSLDQASSSQQQSYRPQPTNWNTQSQQSSHQGSDDWFRDGMVDTSDWGLQGAPHKAPFDPYEGQVDTSSWGVQGGGGGGGMPGQMPMPRNRMMNEYDLNENPHDPHHGRMSSFDNPSISDPYRQNADPKNSMMGLGSILPLSSNLPPSQHPFVPRPGPLYPPPGNILRPLNPNGGLSTPPGAIMGQGNLLSPKLPTSSPIPNQAAYVPLTGKANPIPNASSQTPTPSQQQQQQQQQQPGGNGNGNNTNNGAVHAQIMQQFRLAVQAGLISQDLLNTKLPPYMLQVDARLWTSRARERESVSSSLCSFFKNYSNFNRSTKHFHCNSTNSPSRGHVFPSHFSRAKTIVYQKSSPRRNRRCSWFRKRSRMRTPS